MLNEIICAMLLSQFSEKNDTKHHAENTEKYAPGSVRTKIYI
jgi:hypothetical protein